MSEKICYCRNCKAHVDKDHRSRGYGYDRTDHVVRAFGWKYRKPDPRNWRLAKILPKPKVALPSSFSLLDEGLTPPVKDQGMEGSCTGHAFVVMKGSQELYAKTFPQGGLSERYIYNGARALENRLNEEGAYSEDLFIVARKGLADVPPGLCREETWPYMNFVDQQKWPPSQNAQAEAPDWKILSYAQLNQPGDDAVENVKQAIYQLRSAVYIGIPWPQSWMEPDESGKLPMPGPNDTVAGGHAIAIVGWDDTLQEFLIQNSWGDWGPLHGYAWFPYAAISWFEQQGGWDCFKSTDAPSPTPPEPKSCLEQMQDCLAKAQSFMDQIDCVVLFIICTLERYGFTTKKPPTAKFNKKQTQATVTLPKIVKIKLTEKKQLSEEVKK